MLMEAMNLAVVWKLPVLFVCKDDQWAITTPADAAIGNALTERARGFGMPALEVDGNDIEDVFHSTQAAIMHARDGGGPTFIHARCSHVEGHFLGYQLLRIVRKPLQELGAISIPLVKSFLDGKGAPVSKRLESLGDILSLIKTNIEKEYSAQDDPLKKAEQMLSDPERLHSIQEEVHAQVEAIIKAALETKTSSEGEAI
jgi:pyruvate dehydrogenase E1 component alpha subunit